jgi:hypothetical protein
MLFTVSEQTRSQYEAFLQERSAVLNDCLLFLEEACKKVGDAYRAGGISELAVIALVRHVVECLDGVSVLMARGSVLPCYPLLRSIFDASLGVMYIMQGDNANRAAAYFVFQIRQEMAFLERCDPTTNSGTEIRRELQNDIAGPTALDGLSMQEAQKHLATLHADLDDAILKNADQAWITKNKKNAEWYSLFGGPDHLRELAKTLSYLSGYELHYRPWCRQVHATDTLKNLSEDADSIRFRPIRSPSGIHDVLRSAGVFAITLAGRLYGKYDPENSFVRRYKELEERIKTLASVKAPAWDGQFE